MPIIPIYTPPDFSRPELKVAPTVRSEAAEADGIVPDGFHATSNHVDKLATRGSTQAVPVLTNAQDFMANLRHDPG